MYINSTARDLTTLSILKIPPVRNFITGMLIGGTTLGSLAPHSLAQPASDSALSQPQPTRALSDNPDVSPLPIGVGRIDGFGPDESRGLYVFEDHNNRFIEPPFALVRRRTPPRFSPDVPQELRDRLQRPEYAIIHSLAQIGTGPDKTFKLGVEMIVSASELDRQKFARAYAQAQIMSFQQDALEGRRWRSVEVTRVKSVLRNSLTGEILGNAESDSVRGMTKTPMLYDLNQRALMKLLDAMDAGAVEHLNLYAARASNNATGRVEQRASRSAESSATLKMEIQKLAPDGLVSINDARAIQAEILNKIQIIVEVNDPSILPTITALITPDGFILDCLELDETAEVSPAGEAAIEGWMAAGVRTDEKSSSSSSWERREENLKQVSSRSGGFLKRKRSGEERVTSTASGSARSESSATATTQVAPGDVRVFKVNEQKIVGVFEKVANITIQRIDGNFLAVPPIPTTFDDGLYQKQLDLAVRRNMTGLINSLEQVQVGWISIEQFGSRNDPKPSEKAYSVNHDVDGARKELQYVVEGEFLAPTDWVFEPPKAEEVSIKPHLPTQKIELVKIAPAEKDPSKLMYSVQITRSSPEERGGFVLALPKQKIRQDEWSDVSEGTQRLAPDAKENVPQYWTLQRRGGIVDVPLAGLKRERIQGTPKHLNVDLSVSVKTDKAVHVLRLEGDIKLNETKMIDGIMVRYEAERLRLWLDR